MSGRIRVRFRLPASSVNPWSRWFWPMRFWANSAAIRCRKLPGTTAGIYSSYAITPAACNIGFMIRPIVLWGSEVLEKPSDPVTNITDEEVKLVRDMIETMYKAPGVGLAAPQVGISKRIMVTDTSGGEDKNHILT